MPEATLNEVRKYFGITSAGQFSKEWVALTDEDKRQIKEGIGNGSLNY